MIKAVRYWKKRNHPCLEGVSFPDIKVVTWDILWNSQQRKKKEENVIKNWKQLTTKPYSLLTEYHKSFLEENNISSGEELERKFVFQRNGYRKCDN